MIILKIIQKIASSLSGNTASMWRPKFVFVLKAQHLRQLPTALYVSMFKDRVDNEQVVKQQKRVSKNKQVNLVKLDLKVSSCLWVGQQMEHFNHLW